MYYTVKDVSALSGVTIKTLHHYHKIGLLLPHHTSEAGYRMYSARELERLQHILLYRELEFSLERIQQLLDDAPDRLALLTEQEQLLRERQSRLATILNTLQHTIRRVRQGEPMDEKQMFQGFQTEEEWKQAMEAQRTHVQETYGYDLAQQPVDVERMNALAAESIAWTAQMVDWLRDGVRAGEDCVQERLHAHLQVLQQHGAPATAAQFLTQAQFYMDDPFHLNMLESQQIGLAYYIYAAAQTYAAAHA